MKNIKIATAVKKSKTLYFIYMVIRDVYSYLKSIIKGTYSQHGEDLFLREYFKNIKNGFYVDIGASHPFRISNTYLLYRKGWRGIVVEPLSHFKWFYRIWRSRDIFVNSGIGASESTLVYYELTPSVLSSFDREYVKGLLRDNKAILNRESTVSVMPVGRLLSKYVKDKRIDFLSVDVEGLDYEILNSIDYTIYRPTIICAEFNNENDRSKITRLLEKKGYDCSKKIGYNIIAINNLLQ